MKIKITKKTMAYGNGIVAGMKYESADLRRKLPLVPYRKFKLRESWIEGFLYGQRIYDEKT